MGRRMTMQKVQMFARTIGIVVAVGVLGPGGQLEAAAATAGSRPLATAIEGVWEPTVTIRDCASGVELVSFLSMDTYIHDGSYVGVGAPEPHTPGFGRWQHVGGREFTARYQFFTYDPDGIPNGRLRVSATITLAADGNSFTATDTAETLDLDGNSTFPFGVCGTREAKRLY
jgi:hypothetical protein